MELTFLGIAVGLLLFLAVVDITVGVSNDAVNFLNSSIGSRVAPLFVILLIASFGIISGVTFSSGMMEVARKGIFHPQFFTMPELLTIFLAVMLTDVLLLDLFNTYGLPTSTTVSIVFELLGAAVAVSLIKVLQESSGMSIGDYINSAKAFIIVFSILLSIVVAFIFGALAQFVTRLIFTFDYTNRIQRYGAAWGGIAMGIITFFILIKGAKGASFMTPEAVDWIKSNTLLILAGISLVSAIVLQVLISVFRINVFKPIILVGTFALAMAFAANDLVNFIGVPLAGLNAFKTALSSADPLHITMAALNRKVPSQTYLLLIAGAIMVLTLWTSKKSRTVGETEIGLGKQDEGAERFESVWISRTIVQMADSLFRSLKTIVPAGIRNIVNRRITPRNTTITQEGQPSFDLVRAAVNLMVASAVVSFATSMKLPLSTTYVTFMVAMGTSFSDQAWGRESAVFRITGVLTVVGGWFMTALIAFSVSFAFSGVIYFGEAPGVVILIIAAGYVIRKNKKQHEGRVKEKEEINIYNLNKVKDADKAISDTFDHLAQLLKDMRESFDETFDALFSEDIDQLAKQRKRIKHIQMGSNIIMANVFKVLRLLSKDDAEVSHKYAQTIRRLQKLADGHRDIVLRSYMHVSNKHKGLLDIQVQELKQARACLMDILAMAEKDFRTKDITDYAKIMDQYNALKTMADAFNQDQIQRIRDDSSKTRLSILFYAIVGNCIMLSKQNIKLLEILNESFRFKKALPESFAHVDSE